MGLSFLLQNRALVNHGKSRRAIFFCLLSGVIAAQIISSIHVFQSNLQLAETINSLNSTLSNLNPAISDLNSTISQNFLIAVPTGKALSNLTNIYPAFAGALFISLTAGITVSILSLFIITIFLKLFKKVCIKNYCIKTYLIYFAIWSVITLLIYLNGQNLFTAAYTFIIPIIVLFVLNCLSFNCLFLNRLSKNKNIEKPKNYCWTQLSELSNKNRKSNKRTKSNSEHKILIITIIITLSITGIFYYLKCDKSFFLRARDYILLSSRHGEILNDFYYRYNLYAVEAIKPTNFGKSALQKSSEDHNKTIRFLCFVGLTLILPITIYLISYLSIFHLIRFVTQKDTNRFIVKFFPSIAAGLVNIVIALFIFYSLYPLSLTQKPLNIKNMLDHSDYRIRTEGVRELCRYNNVTSKNRAIADKDGANTADRENNDNIWNYPDFIKHAMNGNIAEKYWLANSFKTAKDCQALPYLKQLIDDPSINVQCAAIEAMAAICINQHDLNIVYILERKIVDSDEWYVQKKAYNALKRAGKLKWAPKSR
ncbi:MAG: HEAT repeat domain-containing protein [Desulfamplus sp.]|nr:HEAT repeat domain-containing protein [Desulfamplus sp.]